MSRTLTVSAPFVASPASASPYGAPEMRPRAAFSPTRPQHAAGMRIEPPPSEPVAKVTIPLATATAEPPLEPPHVRSSAHGLCVGPKIRLFVSAWNP